MGGSSPAIPGSRLSATSGAARGCEGSQGGNDRFTRRGGKTESLSLANGPRERR